MLPFLQRAALTLLLITGMSLGVRALSAQDRTPSVGVSSDRRISPDSLYAEVHARLTAHGYHFEREDARRRRIIVRAKDDGTRVSVRVVARGRSAELEVTPVGHVSMMAAFRAIIMVTHDAGFDPDDGEAAEEEDDGGSCGPAVELGEARWRPELFLSPGGALWMARSGLFTADTLTGEWRCVPPPGDPPVHSDQLRIGISMAFVNESTLLLGFPDGAWKESGPPLFRSTDGGLSWTIVPTGDMLNVHAMAASDQSVWVFGARHERAGRRDILLRSADGGISWEQSRLPISLNRVTGVYRTGSDTGFVSTTSNGGSVFWRTTDGGVNWLAVPTPHDQGVHVVPPSSVRINEIAVVGDWLVVREYGSVFVTRVDDIRWRRLGEIRRIAGDPKRGQLFVLTNTLRLAMLDRDMQEIWRTTDRVVDGRPSNIEKLVAHDGIGYVSMTSGAVYEAKDGVLRLVEPGRDR